MTERAQAVHRFADKVRLAFRRSTAVAVGLVLIVIGVAMTISVVLLPVGIVLWLLGVAILVGGLFAPNFRR